MRSWWLLVVAGVGFSCASGMRVEDAYVRAYDPVETVAVRAMEVLGATGTRRAQSVLEDILRGPDVRPAEWAAAGRALIAIAEAAIEAGDDRRGGDIGHHLFLSSSPPDVRRRAFAAFVRGRGDAALSRIEIVLAGRQDQDMFPLAMDLLEELGTPAALTLRDRFRSSGL